ncbi:MAG: hypothetical protein R3C46_01715 [Hyphomonadaceae bacterium]
MRALLFAAFGLLAGCGTPPQGTTAQACAIDVAPTIMEESGDPHGPDGRLLQVWDIADDPALWSDACPPALMTTFWRRSRRESSKPIL